MQYKTAFGSIHRFLIKLLYPYASRIICNTEGAKTDLIENFYVSSNKIHVIPNGYDIAQINEKALNETHLDNYIKGKNTLSYVARLTYGKAHVELLSIFKEVKKSFPDALLILLGDGPMKERVIQEAKKLRLSYWFYEEVVPDANPDILFLGFQKNPYSFVSKSKVFVSPSKWEGLPNAIIESLICGTPVISSDCPTGPKEVLKTREIPEVGILLPPFKRDYALSVDEISTWSDAICKVLASPEALATLRENGRKRSIDYSKEKILKKWRNAIQ